MAPVLSKSVLLFLLLSPLTQGACIHSGSQSSFKVQEFNNPNVADAPVDGYHRSFFEDLPAVLEKARVEGGIPGMAVAIMHKGHLVFAQGFGKRNNNDPFTTEVTIKKNVNHLFVVSPVLFLMILVVLVTVAPKIPHFFVDCVSYRIRNKGFYSYGCG